MANDGWKLVNPKTRTYRSLATGEMYSYRRYRERVLLGKKLEQYASERKEKGVVPIPPSRKILNNDSRANEALYLINNGYSAKEAARKVGLSDSTISSHLKKHKNATAPTRPNSLRRKCVARFLNSDGRMVSAEVDNRTASNIGRFQNALAGASGKDRERILRKYQDYEIIDIQTGARHKLCTDDAVLERRNKLHKDYGFIKYVPDAVNRNAA